MHTSFSDMAEDPFDSVANEVESSIKALEKNVDTFLATIKNLQQTNALTNTKKNSLITDFSTYNTDIKNLEWDLTDLKETVDVASNNPEQFNLVSGDVISRQNLIDKLSSRIHVLKSRLDNKVLKKLEVPNAQTELSRFTKQDEQKYEEEQTQIFKTQNQHLDKLANSMNR